MNQELIRPCIINVDRKPRLYNPDANKYYAGYIQNKYLPSGLQPYAYIFSGAVPEVGTTLIDRLDGEVYHVENINAIKDGFRIYNEITLTIGGPAIHNQQRQSNEINNIQENK